MVRILVAILSFCLLGLGLAPTAHAAKRVAFVVGIDAYDNLPEQQQLKKAVNDAHALGETLAALGYDVVKADNVARLDFLRQWQLFLNRLEPGDEAAVFFAGHGMEIGGQNFLLPRDVPRVASGEEEVLKASGLSFDALLDQVRERRPQVGLYILDACRDNPFVDGKGRGIGGTRGLARVEPPSGTFIMFSAGAQESALDRLSDNDPNPNSVYTRTLLPRLKAAGKITDIARDVRREVRELAASVAHVQTPAYYDEVVGDFCPAGCEAKVAAAEAKPAAPQIAPPPADASQPAPVEPAPPLKTAAALTPLTVEKAVGPGHAPINDCDRLAADPNNPDSVDRGVDLEDTIDHARAIPACEEAVRLYPQERRFAFQLARAEIHAKKPELAKPLLETFSNAGYAIAGVYLGYLYEGGTGVAKNAAEALRLYRQAADAGDAFAALVLATAYNEGRGVAKDEAEGLRWLRKAADAGSASAMTMLADQYAGGKLGLAQSDAEAAVWYRKAADRGDVRGLYDLALMYQDGRGVAKDEAEAARLFQAGDGLRSGSAMIHVGLTYDVGQRVTKDELESLRWYRKAADLGDPEGMFFVAMAYHYGNGVARNQTEAARWYRQAAELGQPNAMTSLAEMYEKGEGVPQDATEAARWRKAAESGVAPASAPAPSSEGGNTEEKVAAVAPSETRTPLPSGQNGGLIRSFGPAEHDLGSVAFSPDGKQIVTLASGGYFMHLDAATGTIGKELGLTDSARPCCQLIFSPDGRYLLSGNFDNMAMLWDPESGALVRSLKGHKDYVVAVAFSPDGKRLASGSYDTTVGVWDTESGKLLRRLEAKANKVQSVAFSPDGKLLASGHDDGDIRIWDVASGKALHSLKADVYSIGALAFSPDGTMLAAKSTFDIRLWNVSTEQLVRTLNGGSEPISFSSMVFSPDGTELATGDSDHFVRLWNVSDGKQLQTFQGHTEDVRSVAFSPDGTVLASGSNDKTVKLWDLGSTKAARR